MSVSCDERERYFLCFPFFVTATHFQTMLNGFVFTLLLVVTSVELTLCYDSICTEAVVTFDTLAVSVKVSMS